MAKTQTKTKHIIWTRMMDLVKRVFMDVNNVITIKNACSAIIIIKMKHNIQMNVQDNAIDVLLNVQIVLIILIVTHVMKDIIWLFYQIIVKIVMNVIIDANNVIILSVQNVFIQMRDGI